MQLGLFFLLFMIITSAYSQPLPINSQVNQSNIEFTTCQHGWTKSIRPAVSTTKEIKHLLMSQLGFPPEAEPNLILDHKIPLVLGGAPVDINNLMLQPKDESKDKDRIEVCLARTVCKGLITLLGAQKAIWFNWKTAGRLCRSYEVLK